MTAYSKALSKISKDYDRRITDVGIMARKPEFTRFRIHLKNCDVVSTLVAAIKELARRIHVEAARVIPSRPFISNKGKVPIWSNRKDPNAVVQPVACINKFSIG